MFSDITSMNTTNQISTGLTSAGVVVGFIVGIANKKTFWGIAGYGLVFGIIGYAAGVGIGQFTTTT